jgi:methionyl-tRNA synthetase
MANRFSITTPIYYATAAPSIGSAYTTVVADMMARWHRQRGDQVWFLTGTDEHGEKVMRAAEAHGVTPQEWADKLVAEEWIPVLDVIDASNDDFIRTTEKRHTTRVQEFWQRLYDKGYVYEGTYEGPYCVDCEEFKLPGELVPDPDPAAGVGAQLCAIHLRPVDILAEDNYFFRMSDFTDRLLALYENQPDFVQPASARNEVLAFVKQGLTDLSISRSSFDWGVPVPWDEKHVFYVWIDALLNYITAAGFGTDDERFSQRWPATNLVGKDILRFHAVIWPAMLMAAEVPVPRQVYAHGWLLVSGQKMSKSKATAIHPSQVVDHFGVDAYRYYFLKAIAVGSDGSFSWEHLTAVYTSELANGLGNLASRTAAMVGRYFDGKLPAAVDPGPAEQALVDGLADVVRRADDAIDRLASQEAINAVEGYAGAVNGYLSEQAPWTLAKDEDQRERVGTILATAAEALRAIAVLYHPVMPRTSRALWSSLGADQAIGRLADQRVDDIARWGQLSAGTPITKGAALFPRLADDAPMES